MASSVPSGNSALGGLNGLASEAYVTGEVSAFIGAGYEVEVIPNQGRGAATQRIEALRRVLPRTWFNEETTAPGLEARGRIPVTVRGGSV